MSACLERPVNLAAGRFGQEVLFSFTLRNLSPRDIRAFTFKAKFADLFDRPLTSINISYDDPLLHGSVFIWRRIWTSDLSLEGHKRLLDAELDDLKFEFQIQAILFTDGTRLGQAE